MRRLSIAATRPACRGGDDPRETRSRRRASAALRRADRLELARAGRRIRREAARSFAIPPDFAPRRRSRGPPRQAPTPRAQIRRRRRDRSPRPASRRRRRARPVPPTGCDAVRHAESRTTTGRTTSPSAPYHDASAPGARPGPRPHLGGRSDRHVDDDMGRAGGGLLRQDGRRELTVAVEVEQPLDADQNVVCGAEPHRAAPDEQPPSSRSNDAAHRGGGSRVRRASASPSRRPCVGGRVVMAREEVFGMTSPAAAAIATTIGEVRLPEARRSNACRRSARSPTRGARRPASMDRVSAAASSIDSRAPAQAVRKAEISTAV